MVLLVLALLRGLRRLYRFASYFAVRPVGAVGTDGAKLTVNAKELPLADSP